MFPEAVNPYLAYIRELQDCTIEGESIEYDTQKLDSNEDMRLYADVHLQGA
jgi:hypothetical protein